MHDRGGRLMSFELARYTLHTVARISVESVPNTLSERARNIEDSGPTEKYISD